MGVWGRPGILVNPTDWVASSKLPSLSCLGLPAPGWDNHVISAGFSETKPVSVGGGPQCDVRRAGSLETAWTGLGCQL